MMTSFGDGIRLTPLELTSIVASVANGGTMYYLQYPKNQDDVQHFVPRVRRQLDIARFIPEIRPGMMGAVEYGTAAVRFSIKLIRCLARPELVPIRLSPVST